MTIETSATCFPGSCATTATVSTRLLTGEMKRLLETARVDLIVGSGFAWNRWSILRRELRTHSRVLIILLTLLGGEIDRIVGLEVGADDYLAKPFNRQELLVGVRAACAGAMISPSKAARRMPPYSVSLSGRWIAIAVGLCRPMT